MQEYDPPRPRSLDRRVPRDLDVIAAKAMGKRPVARYPDAAALAADLRRHLAGEPIKARRITLVGKTWRWAKRNPAVAGLLAALVLVFAGGTGASLFYANRAADREWEAERNFGWAQRNADTATTYADKVKRYADIVGAEQEAARRLVYATSVNLAGAAYREADYRRAEELLVQAAGDPEEEDIRGWEWHAQWRRRHPESRRTKLPGEGTVVVRAADRVIRRGACRSTSTCSIRRPASSSTAARR